MFRACRNNRSFTPGEPQRVRSTDLTITFKRKANLMRDMAVPPVVAGMRVKERPAQAERHPS
jgi:hypothetical protein